MHIIWLITNSLLAEKAAMVGDVIAAFEPGRAVVWQRQSEHSWKREREILLPSEPRRSDK